MVYDFIFFGSLYCTIRTVPCAGFCSWTIVGGSLSFLAAFRFFLLGVTFFEFSLMFKEANI